MTGAPVAVGRGPSAAAYPLRNLHPVQLAFLSPDFDPPRPAAGRSWSWGFRLEESNALNGARSGGASFLVDSETTRVVLDLRHGLGGGWEAGGSVAWIRRWGGWLNAPIEVVERAVSQLNPLRDGEARGRTRILLESGGERLIDVTEASGLGDATLWLRRGFEAGDVRWSLGAVAELPTGSRADWLGNGGADYALVLAAGWGALRGAWAAQMSWTGVSDPFPSSSSVRAGDALAAELGGTWRTGPRSRLFVQYAWRGSPIRGTGLAELERDLHEVAAGFDLRVGPRLRWQVGGVENLVVEPGADFSLLSRLVFESR